MSLHTHFSCRIVNRTRYVLRPRFDAEAAPGPSGTEGDIGPLGQGVVVNQPLDPAAGPLRHGVRRYALYDALGADTLSRLMIEWWPSAGDGPPRVTAVVEGRESTAVSCTVTAREGAPYGFVCTLDHRA